MDTDGVSGYYMVNYICLKDSTALFLSSESNTEEVGQVRLVPTLNLSAQ